MSRHFPGLAQGWSEEEEYNRQEDYKQQPAEGENGVREGKLKELQRRLKDKERKEKPVCIQDSQDSSFWMNKPPHRQGWWASDDPS